MRAQSGMSPEGVSSPPQRRELQLDFIRGIAILMVLDFHNEHALLLLPFRWIHLPNFGAFGVDIFFVLSGFLVGGLLIKEWILKGSIDARRFLIRRGFKIWPQYYVYLLIMLVSGHRSLHSLWGNLLNIQNYVAGSIAHTWTLAVEEHAYLLLALLLTLAARRRLRLRTVFLSIAVVCVVVVAWMFLLQSRGVTTFPRTDTRIQGILFGVLLAILYHARPHLFARIRSRTWLWMTLLLGSVLALRLQTSGWWGLCISYVAADLMGVALLLLLYRRRAAQHPLLYRVVAWIGVYSYGIYLWHISVIEPSHRLLAYLPPRAEAVLQHLVPQVAGIALGVIATRLVEFPALALRDRLLPRRVDSAVGVPAEIEHQTGVETPAESFSA